MSNGAFQPGRWGPLPPNCTRSFKITYYRLQRLSGAAIPAKCGGLPYAAMPNFLAKPTD